MSQISLKSISGITSITTSTGVDNQLTLHTNNTTQAFKLDHAGNLHFNNHVNTTGISTASNFKTGTSNLHNTGLNVQDLDVDGHTNLDNTDIVGILTVTSTTQYGGYKLSNNSNIVGELVGLSGSNDTGALALWSGGSKYVQLSAIGNSYLTGGSLGIGTNNIDSPLEVVGTGPSLVTIHHGDGGTNDEARIMLGALPNNPPDNRGAGIAAVNNGAGHDLIIKCSTNHSLSPSEKVRIDSAGNLSLGKGSASSTSYGRNLQIHHSGTSGAAIHLTDNNTGSGNGDGFHIISTSSIAYLWQRENANMVFGTNGAARWNIYGSNGHLAPNADSTFDIGTSSVRVRNGYFDTLYGDGSNLTGITGTTINNNADNRVITGSGTANTLNGEANITYDATTSLLKLATASSTSTDAVLLHLVGGGTSDRGLKISTGRASGAGQNHAAAIYDAINSESSGYGSQHRFKIAGTDCFTIGYNGDFGFVGVNDNVPYPDTVGGNTVNTCLELGSPSGTDTASVIKFNGRDGSGNLNKCQMQWCGANNRFDITVNGNQALQIQPNKDVEVTDGDLVIGTSGHGISFSATGNAGNSASMQNELLDDYEEGTWTPFFYAWIGGGVPATTDIAVGTYTKIGRCVHINFDLKADRGSMAHNYITMGGLPFAHLGSRGGFASIAWTEYVGSENSTSATRGHGIEFGGGATVHCWLTGYTSTSSYLPTYLSTSYMSNGSHTRIQGSATYFTNA